MSKHILKSIIITAAACTVAAVAQAAPWEVPADKAAIVNPVPVSERSLMRGEGAYRQLCQTCHGADGHGNKLSLTYWFAGMPDTAASVKGQTDGAVFYKIYNGREAMPPFSNTLMPEDIWNIINYLKNLK